MKKSNRLILLVTIALLSGMLGTDVLLKKAYSKINVNDPFKNYQDLAVRSFKALVIKGGNAYAIHVRYGKAFNIKVMNSRKGFLTVNSSGDTLSLLFTVPKSSQQQAVNKLPAGVIIYCPDLSYLHCTGTAAVLSGLKSDSLKVEQQGYAITDMEDAQINKLHVYVKENSWFDFRKNNAVHSLSIRASGDAGVSMKEIVFDKFQPQLNNNGKILFYQSSMSQLPVDSREPVVRSEE
jgi:hypothetical protein